MRRLRASLGGAEIEKEPLALSEHLAAKIARSAKRKVSADERVAGCFVTKTKRRLAKLEAKVEATSAK